MRKARYAAALGIPLLALLSFTLVTAWTGPTAAPPGNNVAAPINVGNVDQVKNSGLGVNSLAVFGNALLSGVGRYFNFGSTAGTGGYGIRDNAGLLEFKDSGGSWESIQATVFNLVGGASSWTVSGNNIYNSNTGNVGIGTVNPQAKLHVDGTVMVTENQKIGFRYSYTDPGPYQYITANGADAINFYNNYTSTQSAKAYSFYGYNGGALERATILNSGNVGIGTASPSSKLTVVGGTTLSAVGWGNDLQVQTIVFPLSTRSANHHHFIAAPSTDGNGDLYFGTVPGIGPTYTVAYSAKIDGSTNSWTFLNNVSIGAPPNSPASLYVGGNSNVVGYSYAANFYQNSDERLKKNIRTSPGLDIITKLRGVLFDWKKDGTASAGVIAQQVELVMPVVVSTGAGGVKSVNYNALIAPLIEAVKEQQAEIDAQNAEIESLKSDNAALKRGIEELRSAIGSDR